MYVCKLNTCIEDVGELLAAKISTDACFADSIVAVVAADEVTTLTTPATLLVTAVGVLLDVCVVVQRVAFLQDSSVTLFSSVTNALITITATSPFNGRQDLPQMCVFSYAHMTFSFL